MKMATDKQCEKIQAIYSQLDNRNASVVLTLAFALIRDQERMASRKGAVEAPALASSEAAGEPRAAGRWAVLYDPGPYDAYGWPRAGERQMRLAC
jgi:hypothetical protein